MSTPSHEDWIARLSDYLDGDLDASDADRVKGHLAECAMCRAVLADLEEIVERAAALGDVQPERDLWPGIAGAIRATTGPGAQARVIPFPGDGEIRRRRGTFLTVPQMAAASVVLVAISAAATWWAGMGGVGHGTPTVAADGAPVALVSDLARPPEALARELSGLERVFAQVSDSLDPGTVLILEKNLGVIQRAIDESVRALAVDPANTFLRDHLERAYREKASFLREVTTFAGWEG